MNFQVAGDVRLNAAGTDVVLAEGLAAIRQRIENGLTVFLEAWPYDKTAGIPYFQQVLLKGVTTQQIRAVFADFLRSVGGIVDILKITVREDSDRTATVEWLVRVDTGEKLDGTVPFDLVQT